MAKKYRDVFFNDSANQPKSGLHECVSCHKKLPKNEITVDHILPQSKGGGHSVDNLQAMCRSCNSSKNNKTNNTADDYIKNGKRIMNADIRNVPKKDVNELNKAIENGFRGIMKWLKK